MAASNPYRFGDLLALARLDWVRQMADRLAARGYPAYRRPDALSLRVLDRGASSLGELASLLGVSRQAARKIVDSLKARGYAKEARDADDSRRVQVVLTDSGVAYAQAVRDVIETLNRELADRVPPSLLVAADTVLRAAISDEGARRRADRLVEPPRQGQKG